MAHPVNRHRLRVGDGTATRAVILTLVLATTALALIAPLAVIFAEAFARAQAGKKR